MGKRWSRLRLSLPKSFVDWVSAEVVEWGSPGVEVLEEVEDAAGPSVGQMTIDIYFPRKGAEPARDRLESFLERLGSQVRPYSLGLVEEAPDVDWAEQWKYNFPPLEIGKRLLILPPWESEHDPGDRLPILLQPGMAFGTGHHPTSSLIIEALDSLQDTLGSSRILDLGCGSGILSIAAVTLGAPTALAVDYDEDAVQAALANVEMNRLEDRVSVVKAKFPELTEGAVFDLVLANVYFTFFKLNSVEVAGMTAPGGRLLASGLQEEEADDAIGLLGSAGFQSRVLSGRDGWIVIEGIKQ